MDRNDVHVSLAQRIQNGDEAARNEMIEINIKLVIKVAGRYKKICNDGSNSSHRTYDENDIVSEGVLGLISAVHNWDPDRSTKFSTFAVPHIQRRISRFIGANRGPIKRPVRKRAGDIPVAGSEALESVEDKSRSRLDSRAHRLLAALERIDERYGIPVKMRYGISPYSPHPIKEICKILGVRSHRECRKLIETGINLLKLAIAET